LAQGQEALETTRGLAHAPGSAILNGGEPKKPIGGIAAMSLADKFNLLNEFNILRIICAVFFIPHIVGKITVPATLEFFVKAGFKPPATWMYIAGTIETILCIGLLFGIYLQYVAFIAFIHLLVAAAATYKVTKSWIWVIGGIEYCVFWAICCLVVAMHAYHTGM
jgi:putative oxidoreductase